MTDKERNIHEIEPWELKKAPRQPQDSVADDSNLKSIIRHSFREPILPEDSIFAEIAGQRYQVVDIGSQGLGITTPDKSRLQTETSYEFKLYIGENSLVFMAKIAHISPCDESGQYHCGVKIIDMSRDIELKLQQFLLEHHAKLFTEKNK
ncbi:MAG: PilZ domain-containing protein [Desulfobulbaceae bacterium]|nr:PilZ domain-containing protein [Desulfobulbaceae bacterium]HIJ79239.1 PilZ domain-containing protein [Deltaproteobacteria bacterium]